MASNVTILSRNSKWGRNAVVAWQARHGPFDDETLSTIAPDCIVDILHFIVESGGSAEQALEYVEAALDEIRPG